MCVQVSVVVRVCVAVSVWVWMYLCGIECVFVYGCMRGNVAVCECVRVCECAWFVVGGCGSESMCLAVSVCVWL